MSRSARRIQQAAARLGGSRACFAVARKLLERS
jgi:hypothetical protein